MKKLYIFGLLLLIVAVKTSAQNGPVFNLNKLSNQDTLLSGWKFHPGDNPQWAKPDFDDSHWQLA
ncbi:MAG TPA: hypothetical protein VMU83_03155, partial [Hanamia sp.]|nr:hypothetical protein [Hanamia sp.]